MEWSSNLKQIIIVAIVILTFATAVLVCWHLFVLQRHMPGEIFSSNTSSTPVGMVPYIPTPTGWKRVSIKQWQTQGILAEFTQLPIPTTTDELGFNIEVDIEHIDPSDVLNGNHLVHNVDSSSLSQINGHFVIEAVLPVQVEYAVGSQNTTTEYNFDLTSFYYHGFGLGDAPLSPADLQTLQTMVQAFATQLP